MLLGAGKCTCQNACRDNHCLIALGFSLLYSANFFLAFSKMIRLVVDLIHF